MAIELGISLLGRTVSKHFKTIRASPLSVLCVVGRQACSQVFSPTLSLRRAGRREP